MHLRLPSLLIITFFFLMGEMVAQDIWNTTRDSNEFFLNNKALTTALKNVSKVENTTAILKFPTPEDGLLAFKIEDNSVLPKALQLKYPEIHSFKGICVSKPNLHLAFTCTQNGVHLTFTENSKSWSMESIKNSSRYHLYSEKESKPKNTRFDCESHGDNELVPELQNLLKKSHKKILKKSSKLVGDGQLRVMRMAVTVSGEYSRYFINKAGLQSGTDAQKKGAALAGIATSINRLNVVFERDLGLRFEIIPNNDRIIYLDPNTDPFTSGNDTFAQSTEANTTINQIIGSNNYDIGHLITTGFAGLAQIGGICTQSKADAVSGFNQPEGLFFDFTLFAHEIGHQLGANHTQNYACRRSESGSAIEPGGGSTIMGYAGACNNKSVEIQPQSDTYFHYISIQQIKQTFEFQSCTPTQPINNAIPEIAPIQNYTIPVGAPFYLEAKATDTDNDALTYVWDQIDPEEAPVSPPEATNAIGPMFRSFAPTRSSRRDFPKLLGQNTKWEVLPSVPRTMNFALTVRDGKPGGIATTKTTVNSISTGNERFEVTSQSTNVTYQQNSRQTVTWNVAGTTANGINVENVKIELSYDNGNTYSNVLFESTPNDGSQVVKLPTGKSTVQARIRVSAIRNIFYAINKSTFTINNIVAPDFPEITVTSRQSRKDNLLIFKLKASFPVEKDSEIFFSFEKVPSGESLIIDSNVKFSLDRGKNYTPVTTDNSVILPVDRDEIFIAVPLIDQVKTEIEKIKILIDLPKGFSNKNASSIGARTKKRLTIKENILLYPNPSKGDISLEVSNIPASGYDLDISNLAGKVLFSTKLLTEQEDLDLSFLSAGLYILQITINGEIAVRKLAIY